VSGQGQNLSLRRSKVLRIKGVKQSTGQTAPSSAD
jgi:hypothetical protein